MPQLGPHDVVEDGPAPPPMLARDTGQRGAHLLAPQDVIEDAPEPSLRDYLRTHRKPVSGGEAFLTGASQGASFGFFDELAGLAGAFQKGSRLEGWQDRYATHRDKWRDQLHAAQEDQPLATFGGQLAGGLVTAPVSLPLEGTGFAANAARGAFSGVLAGAGASEADSLKGVVQDAAKGGLVGGAIGGVTGWGIQKAVRGAQGRMDERTIQDITGGRATAAGKKIYQNERLALDAAKKFNLQPDADDPVSLASAAGAARKEVGERIGTAYGTLGDETLGAPTKAIVKAVKGVRSEYGAPTEAPLQRQIDRYLEDLTERWGGKRVTLRDLNAEIGKLENVGFAGAELTPVASKVLKRDLAGALEDVLQARLDEIKDLGGQIAKSSLGKREAFQGLATGAKAAEELPGLNRDYRGLKLIERMAKERAGLPPANRAAGGLRNALGQTLDLGLLVHSPLAFGAKKLGEHVLPAVARGADAALANLYAAAQAGKVTAQMIQQALEVGVPRALVEPFAAGIAQAPDQAP